MCVCVRACVCVRVRAPETGTVTKRFCARNSCSHKHMHRHIHTPTMLKITHSTSRQILLANNNHSQKLSGFLCTHCTHSIRRRVCALSDERFRVDYRRCGETTSAPEDVVDTKCSHTLTLTHSESSTCVCACV